MKKNYTKKFKSTAIALLFICGIVTNISGQCVSTNNNPTGTINVSPLVQTIVSANMFPNDYGVINIATAGEYQVNTSFGTSLNITDNSNVSLASGNNPLNVSFPTAGLYRVHVCSSNSGGSRIVAISPKNRGFNFDGIDDFIDCGIAITNTLKGTDKLTVEAWVYPTQNTVGKSIIGNHQSNTQFDIQQTNDKYTFFIGFGSYAVTTASNSVVLNTWQHIAGVFDDTSLKFYINGVLSGTTAVPSTYALNVNCATNLWIGKSAFGGENFQGSIDEVRIWNRAVCQGEIQKNMNGIIPTTANQLLANYHFEQGVIGGNNTSVTSLLDLSGNAYNGTVTNAALTGTTSNWVASAAYPANGASPLVDVAPAFTSPVISVSGASSICNGASTTFTASGSVSSYNWLSGPTTATNSVSPTTTSTYSVFGTNSLGCQSNTATITLTVNALPTVSVTSGAICAGQSYTMVPSGANTYAYSSGSAVVTPTINTSYTVTGTNTLTGCSNIAVNTITVNALPTITVNSGSIVAGSSFTMNPSGGDTYVYIPSGPVVSPVTSTSYTVTGTNSVTTCSNTAVSTVSVQGASLNFDGTDDRVNLGSAITTSLTGSTKVSVEAWVKPTSLTGLGVIVGNYNTTGTAGLQILLRRNGNSFYEFWIGNGGTWYNTNSVATPTLNVWQHVAATWDGTVVSIYVNGVLSGTTTPAISTLGNASNNPVWLGGNTWNEYFTGNIDEVRVWNVARTQCDINTYKNCEIPTTATGLIANYHFNQGVDGGTNTSITTLTDASASAFTGTLTNMTLTGTTSNWVAQGGVTTGSITPATLTPAVGSTVSNSVICSGNSTTLSGTGADAYIWTNGVTDATAFSPTVTATYTVTGTNTLTGCSNTAVNTVTVNALPTITVSSGAVCAGQSYTIIANGATTYTSVPSLAGSVVTPTATTNYSITGTDANGCVSSNTAVSTVTVNNLPTVSVTSGAICSGKSFTMVPTGANTYTYSSGSAVVSPTATANYSVTGTSAQGCVSSNTAVSTVTVNALPMVMAATNSTLLCVGNSATLTATGATSYTWNTTATTAVIAVSPTTTVTYTVNGTGANGCSNAATVTQSVSTCAGIATLSNDAANKLYPNPNNGLFTIELTSPSKVTVTNALGQIVIAEKFEVGNHNLDIINQSNGVYFVKIIENNKQQIIKVIKQ
jgi:hypothetical protein